MTDATPFTRLPSRSRADQVRDQLTTAIRSGVYPVGSKLPPERELVDMFGVSRVSLREGIRSLEAIGLVEVRHGNGCFVTDPARRPANDLIKWLVEHRGEVLDMLMVRGALDAVAAEQAARRRDPEAIVVATRAHEAFVAATYEPLRDLDRIAELDIAFHLAVATASGSSLLIDLLGELHQHLNQARRAAFEFESRLDGSRREHQAILDAIVAGDEEAARATVTAHIGHVRDSLSTLPE